MVRNDFCGVYFGICHRCGIDARHLSTDGIPRFTEGNREMIQVLIYLTESAYKEMCENGIDNVDYDIRRLMRNGTPLPKGHGRLIDADAFIQYECGNCDGFCDNCDCDCLNCNSEYRCDFIKHIDSANVIIEADKEGEEKG